MNTYSAIGDGDRSSIQSHLTSSFPIIQAVIEGTQEGWIFRNERQDFWVLHKAGFSECFLARDNDAEWVDFVIGNHEVTNYFHLYDPKDRLVETLKSRADALTIRERVRIQLGYPDKVRKVDPISLDQEFSIMEVTHDNFQSLAVFKLDLEKKFWKNSDEFIRKAFGVFVKDKQHKPVSLCYAAAVGGGKAEIDVVTLEEYRGKRLAKMAIETFVNKCFHEKITPNWDCFEENIASLSTAKKLNFVINRKYKFVSIFKKGTQ